MTPSAKAARLTQRRGAVGCVCGSGLAPNGIPFGHTAAVSVGRGDGRFADGSSTVGHSSGANRQRGYPLRRYAQRAARSGGRQQ